MDVLVTQIVERTGISEDQARQAVQLVVGFLKEKLPAPLDSQIDSLLGSPAGNDVAQQAMGMLGGLLGKQ